MTTYTYIAYNADGIKICGSKNMMSEEAMEAYLSKKKLLNYKIFMSKTRYRRRHFDNVSPMELSVFCRHMSVMFFSEITFLEGVQLIEEQTENKELKIALEEIYNYMSDGYTIAESMAMYEHIFGRYLANMISIGESSGSLDNVFSMMADYFEKEYKMRKGLRLAITYPAILTILMGAIVLLLILKILPMFHETLYGMGQDIPIITKIILNTSTFINNYIVYFIGAIIIIFTSFVYYIRTEDGQLLFDKLKVTVPISKYIYTRIITARFAKSLSILLKSGVQIVNALDEIRLLIDNSYIEDKFVDAISKVKDGEELANALKEIGIFPALFLKIVTIGQKTGRLDDLLDNAANVFDNEVEESLEKFRVMIEPILIIILACIVGVILVSVMLPMISIMNSIG